VWYVVIGVQDAIVRAARLALFVSHGAPFRPTAGRPGALDERFHMTGVLRRVMLRCMRGPPPVDRWSVIVMLALVLLSPAASRGDGRRSSARLPT
jgi:hypothetical protein